MKTARHGHTATLLGNGKVLAAGGCDTACQGGNIFASAELYDPTTDTWTAAASMGTARNGHTENLLSNGKVLVVGGCNVVSFETTLASAELYDPATDTWTTAAKMAAARYWPTVTLLNTGQVLVTGGADSNYKFLASAELYDPATNTWSSAGLMATVRYSNTATLLNNGKVLVTGGGTAVDARPELASTELFTYTAPPTPRPTATRKR